MNYIDFIIFSAVALYMYMGYLRGFIRDFSDLLALIGATFLAYYTYEEIGVFITSFTTITGIIADIVAFFLIWFIVLFLYYGLMIFFYDHIPEKVRKSGYNKWFGLLPSFLRAVLFIWLTINLISLFLPAGQLRDNLNKSRIASSLVRNNESVSNFLNKILDSKITEAIDFLTVKPQSSEYINLGFTTKDVEISQASADEMLKLLNAERVAMGEKELVLDEKLSKVGEAHCIDMFERGYFSHNTPEGKTPFDRMNDAGLIYLIAGENLALAPSVDEAFEGLLASPGHKANMLSDNFGKVGICAIDGGPYGIMFAQEFTN